MFQLAGVDYEDVRVEFKDWKDFKAKTPLGQMPVLEVDGKEIPQSGAIYRYVARKFGFYPTDEWEAAKVDVVTETVGDLGVQMSNIVGEKNADKKEELKKVLTETNSKRYLGNLEKLLSQNNEGKGWFVGDKITFADVHVFCLLHDQYPTFLGVEAGGIDYLSKDFQLLHGFVTRFKAEPKVAEWLGKRPVTSW